MKSVICVITLTIIASKALVGCIDIEDSSPAHNIISIISLKEKLPLLEDGAKSWQKDAYLRWVRIPIRLEYPDNSRIMTAAFNSPSSEFESLLVYFDTDGSITHEIEKHQIPVYQEIPITRDDWKIDSQEALDLMLDEEGLEFLRSKGENQCNYLVLERHGHQLEEHVVWNLTLSKCFDECPHHLFLDPITGEILEEE